CIKASLRNMNTRHCINAHFGQEEFLRTELTIAQPLCLHVCFEVYAQCAPIFMQVNNIIIVLTAYVFYGFFNILIKIMEPVNVWIADCNRFELCFGKEMHLCARNLLLEATDSRGC